ncbi:U3 small nucleolar ribonucleoprotein protein MPP10 [Drosophila tropicalis]|uniref:U3 small nucleolar ribonucleoprotein protein MPP10 n=1 Tax=Drosophila tropicalis TaxID=46794 RepID=UPI0035ABA8E5
MIGSKKKVKMSNVFKEIAENFDILTQHPDRFLKPQPEKIEDIQQLIQQTYAVSISGDVENKSELLPELIMEDMDEEQIWQQMEIRNELLLQQLIKQTAQLTAMKEQHLGIELDDDDDEEEEPEEDQQIEEHKEEAQEQDSDSSQDDLPATKSKTKPQKSVKSKRVRKSVVDDTFFKLDEMKEFLEQEDAKEMRKHKNKHRNENEEDLIDHFAEDFGLGIEDDDEDDEDEVNANYADFFDMDEELEQLKTETSKQTSKQKDFFNEQESDEEQQDNEEEDEEEVVEEDHQQQQQEDVPSEIDETEFVGKGGALEPASDSDSDGDGKQQYDDDSDEVTPQVDPATQSSNELREARLLQRIRDYEDIVLGDKPWQLKGEVQSSHRPQNSLLEEILEFDSTTRPSVAITEEDNRSIEDIIKQRIRDKAWDDVVRSVRPNLTPQEYRKQLVLDQEKSKQSLAQIYEQQYQRELDKIDPNRNDGDDSSAPAPKEHQEIRRAMQSLFLKLDALSNFHFTPKPVAPEIKIVTNTPAVNMEEVAPVAVSDAKLLAPEEVFRGPKHAPLGKTERTSTDKKRERRKKKQKQRAVNSALEARDLQRAKEGKAPTKREADAKLLKSITKSRNVQKITTSNDQSALKSSKAFFNKLQDTTTISSSTTNKKRPKQDNAKANAKKLKL